MNAAILGLIAFLYLCASVVDFVNARPLWGIVYLCFGVSNWALILIGSPR